MEKIVIEKNKVGIRIDKFLFSFAKTSADKKEEVFFNLKITRGEIIRQIKSGNILVNNKAVKPSYSLKENDVIEIMEHKTWNREQEIVLPNSDIKLKIIYQDDNVVVIDKPAGLQAHPDQHEKTHTVANALVAQFPEIKNVGEDLLRPGIVHRLDKDTSGIMVVARNQKTFEELKKKFKTRQMKKIYWAIVVGSLGESGSAGVIDRPLARAASYRKQVVAAKKTKTKIRPAVTEYRVIKNGEDFSLLEVFPRTGRMHQIRVHLFSLGHSIMGDKIYRLKNAKIIPGAARQMLHAKSLEFELESKKYHFEAELPVDFREILASLDENERKG